MCCPTQNTVSSTLPNRIESVRSKGRLGRGADRRVFKHRDARGAVPSAFRGGVCLAWLTAVVLPAAILPIQGLAQETDTRLKQADNTYRAGQIALAQKDLSVAQSDFAEVVRLTPQEARGYSALGVVMLSRGEMKDGIHELKKALAIQPSDNLAQLNLALALEQTGSSLEAIPIFAKLKAKASREGQSLSPSVMAAYARALAQAHQVSRAEIEMESAVALDSRNADWRDELGSLYAQQSDWDNAQRQFVLAVRLNPGFAIAHMHLGIAMRAQKQAKGIDELAQAFQLAPSNSMIALELANALVSDGNDAKAIPIFRHVLQVEPGSIDTAYQLALALQRTDHPHDAMPLFRQVIAAQPNNSAPLTNLGLALCQTGDMKEALTVLQRAVTLDPSNVIARENLAVAFVQLNQFDEAVHELTAAIQIAPDQPQLHYDLGVAYKWQDRASNAIAEMETVEHLDPTAPEPHRLLGYLYMQEGRFDDAAREMRLALKLRPDDSEGWATLGSVCEKLNELPEAESALREAIRQNPAEADAHLTLATVLVKQNDLTQAREERSKAADLMRTAMNYKRAEVATHAGEGKLRAGDVPSAVSDFQDAISYDPGYAEAHLELAKALDRQGKTMEAAVERESTNAGAQNSTKSSSK
jgi:protein O-GlcNAc transferase